jgi:hypothetical protein
MGVFGLRDVQQSVGVAGDHQILFGGDDSDDTLVIVRTDGVGVHVISPVIQFYSQLFQAPTHIPQNSRIEEEPVLRHNITSEVIRIRADVSIT